MKRPKVTICRDAYMGRSFWAVTIHQHDGWDLSTGRRSRLGAWLWAQRTIRREARRDRPR